MFYSIYFDETSDPGFEIRNRSIREDLVLEIRNSFTFGITNSSTFCVHGCVDEFPVIPWDTYEFEAENWFMKIFVL